MEGPDLDDELRAIAGLAPAAGIFCDFDGSLSEIVDDPDDAVPFDGAVDALMRLARAFALVAIVSGRAVSSLEARLHVPGARLLGLYGIEQSVDGTVDVIPEAASVQDGIERARRRLVEVVESLPGVHVEHKGLAIAVHFRRAPDPAAAETEAESIIRSIAAGERLSVVRGRRTLEVRPRVTMDKGEAVRRLIGETGVSAGLVAGDDVGDLPMFEAVGALPRALRVVIDSDETPTALRDLADVRLRSPAEFVQILARLADLAGV